MRGPELLSWLMFLGPLIKNRRAKKAMEGVPEVMAFRQRFKDAFDARVGLGLSVEEVQQIGKALGLR